ncbi:hypothetical protein ACOME3_007444 [Neoechinorhynchus agilis]
MSSSEVKVVALSDGYQMPVIALGTFKDKSSKMAESVLFAIKSGYRHFDLAYVYENEKIIGQAFSKAIAAGTVDRKALFITNKLPCSYHRPNRAWDVLERQLAACECEYFDLYLVHWPMAFKDDGTDAAIPLDKSTGMVSVDSDASLSETWKTLVEMKKSGKVRSIGVSNFNELQLNKLLFEFPNDPPVVNQIEVNPYVPSWELVEFCQERGIVVEAYAPLGARDREWAKPNDPVVLEDDTIVEIAHDLKISPAQVIMKWVLQRNIALIVKSCNESRICQNIQTLELKNLPETAMKKIKSIEKRFRYYQIDTLIDHPEYPYLIWEQ